MTKVSDKWECAVLEISRETFLVTLQSKYLDTMELLVHDGEKSWKLFWLPNFLQILRQTPELCGIIKQYPVLWDRFLSLSVALHPPLPPLLLPTVLHYIPIMGLWVICGVRRVCVSVCLCVCVSCVSVCLCVCVCERDGEGGVVFVYNHVISLAVTHIRDFHFHTRVYGCVCLRIPQQKQRTE